MKYLISGSEERRVRVWDLGLWELVKDLEKHPSRVQSVTFSPDEGFLVTVAEKKIIHIWDAKSLDKIKTIKPPLGMGMVLVAIG
ncbi:MAG: WD40 repeat domain-containing protein [Promethearchaeota archaeon]